ncbi:tetratricopeptide repeat protein [Phenylobacterium sp.]|uniref:tetratricopeptide repeat protein n=1 Tax=Phenylobacterium sp. TaxID=1871053 RepID=UPI0030F4AB40
MADETTTPRAKRSRKARPPTTPDPIEIAMEAEAVGQAPHGVANQLLTEQLRLIRTQTKLGGWQIASERASFALKVLTGVAGVAVAGALAAMAWQASRSDGLVVEAFSVPPALVSRGATGEVVARGVLDRLGELDRAANSLQSVRIADAWTQDTKIEVAQTGVSLDDVQRLLRRWLGHETHLTGEVVQTATGVRITARTGVGRTVTAEGSAEQLPELARQAGEALFHQARPVQYAEYLSREGRWTEAKPLLAQVLQTSDDPLTRAAAANALGMITAYSEFRPTEGIEWFRRAAEGPNRLLGSLALQNAAGVAAALGDERDGIVLNRQALKRIGHEPGAVADWYRAGMRANLAASEFDYHTAARLLRPHVGRANAGSTGVYRNTYSSYLAALHETTAARRLATRPYPPTEFNAENWPVTLAIARALRAQGDASPRILALEAFSLVQLGQPEAAREVIATTAADCFSCAVTRAMILSRQGDTVGAERAFRAMDRLYPGQITGLMYWGRERLGRGDAQGALQIFRRAEKLAPRFADPAAWSGEALLALGDDKAAEEAFRKAQPLAPRWGRLHLKWGDALARLGKTEEARAKWRAAATMDLSPADRAALKAHGV